MGYDTDSCAVQMVYKPILILCVYDFCSVTVTEDGKNWSNFSDLYVHDGSFLRIINITLGYDFAKVIKSKYISSLRLYGQIQNLYTFTHYDGMDPEIGYGVDSFSSGIDLGYYPRPRTYLFGVNIKF